jgi:hypothetical protein
MALGGLTTTLGLASCVTDELVPCGNACDCGSGAVAGFVCCAGAGGATVAGCAGEVAGCWTAAGGIVWLRADGCDGGGVYDGVVEGRVLTGATDAMLGNPLAFSGNSTRLVAPPSDSST